MAGPRVILVLGATASGKSSLAIELAQACAGEVISADAMAVYRGMDIGTAKPTASEQAAAPHHLIDVFDPEHHCDVQHWLDLADEAARAIVRRGRTPIIAGGSPLYTKAFLEGLSAGPPRDPVIRDELQRAYAERGGEAMLAELRAVDPTYAADRHPNDERRITRALEVYRISGKPYSSFHTTDGQRRDTWSPVLLGLRWDKETLHRRINARVKTMFADGLVDEVKRLRDRLCPEAAQAVGYKEIIGHLDGAYDQEHARYLVAKGTRHLAKHQATWYRRFPDICWIPGDAEDRQEKALAIIAAASSVT